MSGYNLGVRTRMGIRDIADDSDAVSSIRPRRPLDYQLRRGPGAPGASLPLPFAVASPLPPVVYGYFALMFITKEVIRPLFPESDIFNAASASIVMGIMIIPLVSSLSEDAMSAVPRSLREGAYALGATKFEVARKVVVPAALSGIIASFILAISRAIGETMIVAIAAGFTPNITWNPLESIEAMTAYIVQVSLGDTPTGSIEYKSIFAVGATLFLMTLLMNVLSQFFLHRFREVYE